MANVLTEIINAAVTALNAETFSVPFTAVRAWQIQHTPKDLADLRVTLMPVKMEAERVGRGVNQEDYQFDVVVQQKPATTTNADVDDLGSLLQEITDWFCELALVTYSSGTASVFKREWPSGADGGYWADALREYGIYTGVVRVTCRMHRT